jgi:hypothetical protein
VAGVAGETGVTIPGSLRSVVRVTAATRAS